MRSWNLRCLKEEMLMVVLYNYWNIYLVVKHKLIQYNMRTVCIIKSMYLVVIFIKNIKKNQQHFVSEECLLLTSLANYGRVELWLYEYSSLSTIDNLCRNSGVRTDTWWNLTTWVFWICYICTAGRQCWVDWTSEKECRHLSDM